MTERAPGFYWVMLGLNEPPVVAQWRVEWPECEDEGDYAFYRCGSDVSEELVWVYAIGPRVEAPDAWMFNPTAEWRQRLAKEASMPAALRDPPRILSGYGWEWPPHD